FFQAEDGIRDFHVTGVQTCALPIWVRARRATDLARLRSSASARPSASAMAGALASDWATAPRARCDGNPGTPDPRASPRTRRGEIGRASCRERVEVAGVAVA